MLQRALDQFNRDFAGALIPWILLGLLIMAQFGSWQASGDLDRVCALTAEREFSQAAPEVLRAEVDHICLNHRAET